MLKTTKSYFYNLYTTICKSNFYAENKANLLLNHLTVVYVFFVPFAPHGYAVSFIFTLFYILIFLRGNYLKYINISLSHPITIPFLLFMCVHYLWWFIGTNDLNSGKDTLQYSHYLLYPFFFFLFLDQRFYARILSSFLAGVMFSESLSYLMQLNIIPWGLTINDIPAPWKKSGFIDIIFYGAINNEPTPFLEHSWYSILIAVTSSILFYKSFHSKTIFQKVTYLAFFTTLSINLFFIGGRSGYLLYVLLLTINIYVMAKKHLSLKQGLIALFLPVLIIFSMYQFKGIFHKRVDATLTGLKASNHFDSSSAERLLIAETGLKVIPEHFFLGVGTGDQISTLRSKIENFNNPIQHLRDVHNQYIDLFIEFGLIGFLFYLNILFKIAKFEIENEEKNTVKTLVLTSMILTGFIGSFWYFLPVMFTILIIITTANKNIITTIITESNAKIVSGYISMILLSYTIEKLQ